MAGREPWWWYKPTPTWPSRLLAPFAAGYGVVSSHRMQRTPAYTATLPVICVGNLTAGGTGKTPTTLSLAAQLLASGAKPVILTRGYGGRERGPHWVDAARDRAAQVGDEPLLLAAVAPTLVARDRAAGARAIEASGKATHILLDDGLQNPALAKTRRIAVVDARRGVGNGRVIPAGPLRAPMWLQLADIDAIVLNYGFVAGELPDSSIGQQLRQQTTAPIVAARLTPVGDVDWLNGARVVAFAGIGVPGHFFRMLKDMGADLVATHTLGDHQPISSVMADSLLFDVAYRGAVLVTTEKDRARMAGGDGAIGRLATAARAIKVQLTFEGPDAVATLLGSAVGTPAVSP